MSFQQFNAERDDARNLADRAASWLPSRASLNPDISRCFSQSQHLTVYQGAMSISTFRHLPPRAAATPALLVLGGLLCGCAQMGETLSPAFVDPAKYDLYDCKQLETERTALATRAAELQGLMAKAETGTGGAVVAEVAYRNDYVSVRAQQKLADENWRRNRCHETIVAAPAPIVPPVPPAPARGARSSAR
jgi:hypothetical protein